MRPVRLSRSSHRKRLLDKAEAASARAPRIFFLIGILGDSFNREVAEHWQSGGVLMTGQKRKAEQASASSGTILVVDDDQAFRRLVCRVLEHDGHRVMEASNGAELLDKLADPFGRSEHPFPDLVITDICMPGLSGLEALAALEHADCLPRFIVVTAHGNDERKEQARALGAAAVFDKPVSIDVLRREVVRQLEGIYA